MIVTPTGYIFSSMTVPNAVRHAVAAFAHFLLRNDVIRLASRSCAVITGARRRAIGTKPSRDTK